MYEGNKLYRQYKKEKDELKDRLPEWIGILQDYFRRNYYSSSSKLEEKKRKK